MKILNKRKILFAVFFALVLATLAKFDLPIAGADVGEAPGYGGALIPGDKTGDIEMTKEKVVFDIKNPESEEECYFPANIFFDGCWYAHITADFEMANTSLKDVTMKLFFPYPTGSYDTSINFKVFIDGIKKEFTHSSYAYSFNEMYTYNDEYKKLNPDFQEWEKEREVTLASIDFPVEFNAQKTTKIRIEYDSRLVYEPKSYYGSFLYIMETGSHWKGKIGSGEIIFKFPCDHLTENIFRYYNDFFQIEGNELVWRFENLEPGDEHNIRVTFGSDLIKIYNQKEGCIKSISASENSESSFMSIKTNDSYPLFLSSNAIFLLRNNSFFEENYYYSGWVVDLEKESDPWVKYEFDGAYKIDGINIFSGIPGYNQKDERVFNLFDRPKNIRLTFSDGTSKELVIGDSSNNIVSAKFDPMETSSIKIETIDFYSGDIINGHYLGIAQMNFDVHEKVGDIKAENIEEIADNKNENKKGEENEKAEIGKAVPAPKKAESKNEKLIFFPSMLTIAIILIAGIVAMIFFGKTARWKNKNLEDKAELRLNKPISGLKIIRIAIIASAIILIIAGGIYLWKNSVIQKTQNKSDSSNQILQIPQTEQEDIADSEIINKNETVDEAVNEKEETPELTEIFRGDNFSIKYPKDWRPTFFPDNPQKLRDIRQPNDGHSVVDLMYFDALSSDISICNPPVWLDEMRVVDSLYKDLEQGDHRQDIVRIVRYEGKNKLGSYEMMVILTVGKSNGQIYNCIKFDFDYGWAYGNEKTLEKIADSLKIELQDDISD